MLERLIDSFVSGFVFPGILWNQVLLGIGLAVVFGAVWFAPYWTPILNKPWAWAVLAGSAFFTWIAVAFVQGAGYPFFMASALTGLGLEDILNHIVKELYEVRNQGRTEEV